MSAEPALKKFKPIGSKRFQYQWFDNNPSWRIWVKEVPNDRSKFFCKACKTTLTCGLSEIKKHSLRESHLKNIKKLNLDHEISNAEKISKTSSLNVNNLRQSETTHSLLDQEENYSFNDRVKTAEIRLATFFVEKNIPLSISSDLVSLIKDIGREPGILPTMCLGKRKLTQIINRVICRKETDQISKVLRENKFSVYEISNITTDKWHSLMVRYVDPQTLRVRCELLQMIQLNTTECSKVFESFKNELLKKDIPLESIVSLACDNDLITDTQSSFKTKLSENNPDLIMLPCVCHSSALAAKEAYRVIPQDCERFIKGISIFKSKRIAVFQDFNMCTEESSKILKYAEIRWLMRHKCIIKKILEIWDSLDKFLMEQSNKNVYSADILYKIFQDPATKAYFLFLKFTLDAFDEYNVKFQARESLIHELQPFSMKLLLWFLRKFIKPAALKLEMSDIKDLNISDRDNQLPLEEIDFGLECNEYLKGQLDRKIFCKTDIDLIRENCLQFFVTASEQIRKRLPIDNAFLHCVAVFENKSALFDCDRHFTFHKVAYVNSKLGRLVNEELIENEWKSLYEIDTVTKIEWSKLSFDDMWIQIGFFSTDKGELCFPNLRLLLNVVRSLPHSNTTAERLLSLVPDAKTKKKNHMSIETLNSICIIRYSLKNNNKTAHTMAVTREHLNLMTSDNIYKQTNS